MALKIKNTCKQICKYDKNQICIGCNRTMEETKNWQFYSEREKAEVVRKAEERKNSNGLHTNHLDYYI